jgi:hypothetical protein
MNSKVKCTCGWSWDKSDSSKKDMYICHECGRDNSNNMKNGGWLDNYNDSQASAPEGFEGDGFSNVGRNYSPAWGGQFQMGGSVYPVNYVPQAQMGSSIPGAVGFSYARTQGAAPSNGKYAKKTMASAQNGKEMQYYQNGLDYQPKSISKNGSWLSKYEDGEIVKGDQDGYRNPDNRGKVVEIKGSTMGTDGYKDTLYVVPDVGEPRVVYANTGNHEFPGATKFTEYPMAQNGIRQEQKSLQNLDNLTNFTNYNKPQPGGWLNKYN